MAVVTYLERLRIVPSLRRVLSRSSGALEVSQYGFLGGVSLCLFGPGSPFRRYFFVGHFMNRCMAVGLPISHYLSRTKF